MDFMTQPHSIWIAHTFMSFYNLISLSYQYGLSLNQSIFKFLNCFIPWMHDSFGLALRLENMV